MYYLSRRSRNQVKFPDIWTVNQSFQKQTLDIFYHLYYMLQLQALIINRIIITHSIPADRASLLRELEPIGSVEAEFRANRSVLKFLSGLKRKERERACEEAELLEDIKGLRFLSSKTIEEAYLIALKIFTTFDPAFQCFGEGGSSQPQRLRDLYLSFFEKYESRVSAKIVFKMLSHHISESSPFVLLGWVSEWSRNSFAEEVQEAIGEEMGRHEEQMRRLNNCRGSSITILREKVASPFANSTALPRTAEPVQAIFTNKQSVYGLFLDELMALYKFLPLDLDLTFLKSMRKVHTRDSILENEENLQRAAEVLIESQNKHTKEHISGFIAECRQYLDRYPNALINVKPLRRKEKKKNLSLSPQGKTPQLSKKDIPQQKFFERVKSESKEEQGKGKRSSFLLHPKTNLISFQSSHELVNKYKKQRQGKVLQLPSIIQSNRILSENIRSSMFKNRQANAFFVPINRSMFSNYDRSIFNKLAVSSKHCERPTISIDKDDKLSYSQPRMAEIKQQPSTKQGGERRKRRLMLQLLRDKNKRAFIQ